LTFNRNVNKFKETGSVLDDLASNVGPPITARTSENIEAVKEILNNDPQSSTTRVGQQLGISQPSAWRIMRQELKLYPYKIQLQQRLNEVGVARRLNFANLMLEKIDRGGIDEIDMNKIWMSDEAHFDLTGYVNKQNWRHLGTENPHIAISTPLHPQRVTVWCGMSSEVIIGPIFIEGSVTSVKYQEILESDFFPEIRRRRSLRGYWYQQDGAPPHRTLEVLQCLNTTFQGRLIALDYEKVTDNGLEWPPYSPDLNPCDFFLWGHLKDRVYQPPPQTIEQLKEAIRREIRAIGSEVLKSVFVNFEKRLRHLIVSEGRHFENMVY
jgi:histone-lysine N-methyltransferase SETMAR